MGIGVTAAGVEAGGAVWGGELLAGVPAPGCGGHRHLGVALDGGAAGPLAGGEVFGQLGAGQAIGAEQPAVVGDDLDGAPAGRQQILDALGQPGDFRLDLARQIVLELVAAVIEVAGLQPAPRFGTGRQVEVAVGEDRVAQGGEGLAQLGGTGGFTGAEGWGEVFRQGLALDVSD